jgi:hypothetical protein
MEGRKPHEIKSRVVPKIASESEPQLAEAFNELSDIVSFIPNGKKITAGKGIKIDETAEGIIISLLPLGSADFKYFPFKIYQKE